MVFGVPEILSPYQYRSIEGSGEAGSEGVMKEKSSVDKTGHLYLIWCINTVRRTGFLLVHIMIMDIKQNEFPYYNGTRQTGVLY